MNYWLIFLTGLTTGGISCVAVQGGLLAASLANQPAKNPRVQVTGFLLAKLVTHTLFGAALGFIGSVLQIDLTLLLVFQTVAAVYLVASALNLLEVHPIFRHVVFQPPKFLFKLTRKSTLIQDWFAPLLLGSFTLLIPCGVTQAMEVTAVTSGSPLNGALTMFFFVLGTMPLFIIIGLLTASISRIWQKRLNYLSALLIIILGLTSINGVLTVLNSPFSYQGFINTYRRVRAYETGQVFGAASEVEIQNGVQKAFININAKGYEPNYLRVKKGIPVELSLTTKDNYTCANYFIFKAFNISARLSPTETKIVRFTPDKTGKFSFSCSMGMYTGIMEVI